MDRRERLIAAKKLIEERGWAQGEDVFAYATEDDVNRRHCVATALCLVGNRIDDELVTDIDFFAHVNEITDLKTRGIASWNDAPERTKEQVLAAFDRAIAAAGSPN